MRGRLWWVTLALVSAAALAVVAAGCGGSTSGQGAAASPSASQPAVLTAAREAVQPALDALDADLAAAAEDLASSGVSGAEAEAILQGLVDAHPEVVDFFTQGPDGKIIAIKPAEYEHFVGTQGQSGDDAALLAESGRAQLTATVKAAEGFPAAALIHPVTGSDGTVLGAVAAFISTDQFLGTYVAPVAQAENLDTLWALDTEGINIYDPNKQDLGKDVIRGAESAPYPTLVALAQQMAETPSGSGTYEYPPSATNFPPVVKKAYWDSVGLYDTQWRLVAAFIVPPGQQ